MKDLDKLAELQDRFGDFRGAEIYLEKCSTCKRNPACDPAYDQICPFQDEIYNSEVHCDCCEECYNECVLSI